MQDVQVFHDGARVAQGCVGHEDFSSRETPQFLCEAAFCTNQRGDVKVMTAMKELMRIDTVMAHQTDQGCTVSFPVRRSELIGCFLIDRKAFHDGRGHSEIDLAENLVRRVVQGVIEIEQPDAFPGAGDRRGASRIMHAGAPRADG